MTSTVALSAFILIVATLASFYLAPPWDMLTSVVAVFAAGGLVVLLAVKGGGHDCSIRDDL
jgi:hypothetical protein